MKNRYLKTTLLILFVTANMVGAQSPLSSGINLKIEIGQTGVYKLSYEEISSYLGDDQISDLTKQDIRLYGDRGKPLDQYNPNIDSYYLKQIALQYVGLEDGTFGSGDYVLFYAEGPESWIYNDTEERYELRTNIYSQFNYYFLHIGDVSNQDVDEVQVSVYETSRVSSVVAEYHDFQSFDPNDLNVLQASTGYGSGQSWYANSKQISPAQAELSFTDVFDWNDVIFDKPARIWFEFAGRSGSTRNVEVSIGGETFTRRLSGTNLNNFEALYARTLMFDQEVNAATGIDNILNIRYNINSNEEGGWIDYFSVQTVKRIELASSSRKNLWFTAQADSAFVIETGETNLILWDVSNPITPIQLDQQDGKALVKASNNGVHLYAFDRNNALQVSRLEPVEHQDLQSIDHSDYLIISAEEFMDDASRLLNHRVNYNGLNSPVLVDIQEVYNEFSSGKCDPTAIRNFLRQIYLQDASFNHVLLLGDGSFDHRHIYEQFPDENFIPVYETINSLDPILSFPSDDYYSLLDIEDGVNLRGALDISVGRLPVRSSIEARVMIDKVIAYDLNHELDIDWLSDVTIVADDEDRNIHFRQAESIASLVGELGAEFNVRKIYADAYSEEQGVDGEVNVTAREIINQNMIRGQSVINYIGHGGKNGWADERILRKEDVASWVNPSRLPLFITATCSFAGYDDPSFLSAGEQALLKADGGAIALFTTVRAVYSNDNARLTRSVFEKLFAKTDGRYDSIGDILRKSKNANGRDTTNPNARKFTLLGDPLMKLKFPEQNIEITSINGHPVEGGSEDTISALEVLKVEGLVLDLNGQQDANFNGIVNLRLYDKPLVLKTLGQDNSSFEAEYESQTQIIFKGKATVTNGRFSIEFDIPKDINYVLGKGKISAIAVSEDNVLAMGYHDDIVIGGTSDDAVEDGTGPVIEAYMESESFTNNDLVPSNTTLYVNLYDEQGINIAGQGIGHEIEAVLDGNERNRYVLNDFFEGSLEDSRRGTISFPIEGLQVGQHQILVRAWDNHNNPSDVTLYFVVGEQSNATIEIINYPNPFITETNFRIEHTILTTQIEYHLEIFSSMGRLIKHEVFQDASVDEVIEVPWDGRDNSGSVVNSGVYFYRVTARIVDDETGRIMEKSSDVEKLLKIQRY